MKTNYYVFTLLKQHRNKRRLLDIRNKRRLLNSEKKFLDFDKEDKEFLDKKFLDNRFQKYQFRSL